ncbi:MULTISPECIES: hypothetical protein [unclassified Streptomyces]|uniref:hypothetical protein n=1 Tax=Streptomyces sp. NPDC055082 TaxID=3365718 RepID=UPI0037D08069
MPQPRDVPLITTGTTAASDTTFATIGRKDALVAELMPGTAELVITAVGETLAQARRLLAPEVTETAAQWLTRDDQYEVHEPTPQPIRLARPEPTLQRMPKPAYKPVAGTQWRNLLVTNTEMAELLTMLHAGGAANSRLGTNLLVARCPTSVAGASTTTEPIGGGGSAEDTNSIPRTGSPGSEQHSWRRGAERACPPAPKHCRRRRERGRTTATT